MQFYLMITVVYIIAGVVWGMRMRSFKENIIMIHWYITAVFGITLLECAFMYIEFDLYNEEGLRNKIFVGINIVLSACRNTMARVLTLLVALGYGITAQNVSKYQI